MVINNQEIGLGETKVLKIKVGRIPSGTKIAMNVHVFRAEQPGPTLLVTGGLHGDEINGVETVRRAIVRKHFSNLKKGTVIAIPLLNIYGFINFSRDTPDGKDVNRSFPGNMNGSLSSRVARIVTKKILPHVDFGIDYHTGGATRYNYPQIRYSKGHAPSKELAEAFAAPYLIESRPISKSFRKVALESNVPVIVFEGGESLRYDGLSIEKGINGLRRVMKMKGMIDHAPEPNPSLHFNRTTWVRAERSGLFIWYQQSGDRVSVGEPLGIINDPNGLESVTVFSKKEGYLIGHNNASVVSLGDALFHIGVSV